MSKDSSPGSSASTGETHWRSVTKHNVTTVYGATSESRIQESTDAERDPHVFSWLICESFDDKGNVITYNYKPEDSTLVRLSDAHEAPRTPSVRSRGRHLKRIRYGNTVSGLDSAHWPSTKWLFELVLDYGDHDECSPSVNKTLDWQCRDDPFSTCRAGVEVRHLPTLPYGRSIQTVMAERTCWQLRTTVSHAIRRPARRFQGSNPGAARGGLEPTGPSPLPIRTMSASPSWFVVEVMEHQKATTTRAPRAGVRILGAGRGRHAQDHRQRAARARPHRLQSPNYRWLDLFGEGVAGIFAEDGGAGIYKSNLSPAAPPAEDGRPSAAFAPMRRVGERPTTPLADDRAQFIDLAGDGRPEVSARPLPPVADRRHRCDKRCDTGAPVAQFQRADEAIRPDI